MKRILVLLLVVLLLFIFTSCGQEVSPLSQLSEQQAISVVLTYGVPHYMPSGSPVGQWAAIYEGDYNRWRVQGSVVTESRFGTSYYSTTWFYSTNAVELVAKENGYAPLKEYSSAGEKEYIEKFLQGLK